VRDALPEELGHEGREHARRLVRAGALSAAVLDSFAVKHRDCRHRRLPAWCRARRTPAPGLVRHAKSSAAAAPFAAVHRDDGPDRWLEAVLEAGARWRPDRPRARQLFGHRYARFRGLVQVRCQCLLAADVQIMKKIALTISARSGPATA
jgi:hypothetical protein